MAAIRYLVKDVDRSIAFYTSISASSSITGRPGLRQRIEGRPHSKAERPGQLGARPMPDGRGQEPGGWNRFVVEVEDLPASVAAMKQKGLRFRNESNQAQEETQIQLQDPDGNPIELFSRLENVVCP